MKRTVLRITSIACMSTLFVGSISAQNQIGNMNFSESSGTPKNISQINLANGWENANAGTVDYYHKDARKCSKMGLTSNTAGGQEAFAGDGYAGIIAFFDDQVLTLSEEGIADAKGYNGYSEYLTTKLSGAMVAGKTYNVTFRVSLAEKSGRAVNGLGAHFSKEAVKTKSNSFINVTPQIKSEEVIKSTDKWVEISGSFVAAGGEEYITIGLFNGPDKVERTVEHNVTNNKRAYYYIDGIEVIPGSVKEENNVPSDRDGDGIADADDKCPDVKGVAANNGCPSDRDGDGVVDTEDKCPDVYGSVKNKGCLLSDEEVEIIKTASSHIYFETGSAKIKEESYPDLDRLVAILKKHPEVKARIEGHTDNTGNANKNLELSKARAKSVADYLVSHGEPADHISSEGYGSTKPVASNDTKEGRAQNRRVMIVVSSYDH